MFKRIVYAFGIGAFALIVLLFAFSVDDQVAKGQEMVTGATAGVMVNSGSGRMVLGTVFVATVPGLEGKHLCTSELIAGLANIYGVVQLNSSLQLKGDFIPVGNLGGEQKVFCAPVNTDLPSFRLSEAPLPSGNPVVPLSSGEYVVLKMGHGERCLETRGWHFQPFNNGSPLTFGGLEVYGVLYDWDGETGCFTSP